MGACWGFRSWRCEEGFEILKIWVKGWMRGKRTKKALIGMVNLVQWESNKPKENPERWNKLKMREWIGSL
jgi:hypothetical protein